MLSEQFANLASTTLNGTINNAVTSLVVSSAALFPTTGQFRILVQNELMLVTAVSGTTFTVARAQEGTTAASHSSGVQVTSVLTKGALAQLRKDTNKVINVVTDYGAIGDGSTDDRTAINNAIASASTNDVVYFPPGTYAISSGGLTCSVSNVTLRGPAIIKHTGASAFDVLTITGNYVTVLDLEIDGNSKSGSCLGLTGAHCLVERCQTHHSSDGHGIYLDGQSTTCNFNIVRDCYSHDNGQIGISQNTATDNLISGNVLYNNVFEGITNDIAAYRNRIIGNHLLSNCSGGGAGGISLDQGDLTIISGNQIHSTGSSKPGIIMNNNIAATNYCIISNNVIVDNGGKGIHLRTNSGKATSHCTVTGNVLRNNTGGPITIDASGTNNIIVGNVIDGGSITNNGTGTSLANNV